MICILTYPSHFSKKEISSKLEIMKTTILKIGDTIHAIILTEIKTIVYSTDTKDAPYVKFVLIANSIEFLGSILDPHPFLQNGESENRFNAALIKYFPKKYSSFAKAGSDVYLYQDFRCGMIHQLRPSPKIILSERHKGEVHLGFNTEKTKRYLVLEDFYDDLEKAGKACIRSIKAGKIPDKPKSEIPYLMVKDSNTGHTLDNQIKVIDPEKMTS